MYVRTYIHTYIHTYTATATASYLLPLTGFESHLEHLGKLPVTWCLVAVLRGTPVSSARYN